MKVKISELQGEALDRVVEECEQFVEDEFEPSENWGDGGPIIEREKIALDTWGDEWLATRIEGSAISEAIGPTPLVAAMRCYVVSQLGDEVEVPDELKGGEL
jgi:hypothetical protein